MDWLLWNRAEQSYSFWLEMEKLYYSASDWIMVLNFLDLEIITKRWKRNDIAFHFQANVEYR